MVKTKSHNIRRFSFICTERTEKIPMGSIKNVISEPIEDHDEYHMMVGGKESGLTCVLLRPCSNGPKKLLIQLCWVKMLAMGKLGAKFDSSEMLYLHFATYFENPFGTIHHGKFHFLSAPPPHPQGWRVL